MAKWEELIAARERWQLSQVEMAERLHIGPGTYQRWEAGKSKPQPQHRRRLAEIFEETLKLEEDAPSDEQERARLLLSPAGSIVPLNEPRTFIATHMTTHLWSLAFQKPAACEEKRNSVRQSIKEFDSMNANNRHYQFTRREALSSLAALPMITLGLSSPTTIVPASRYRSALEHCAASVEACWELRRSDDPADRSLAFQCSSKYLATLKNIAQNSSAYRQEALDLATRYAVIKAFLARHCLGSAEAIQYGKEAVALSKETGNSELQVSAHLNLTWSYFFDKKSALALATVQGAEACLLRNEQSTHEAPVHLKIQGKAYSALAIMQAKNGLPPLEALEKAIATNPDQDNHNIVDFKYSNLLLEAGWTCCYAGDQAKAMNWLSQRVDPETFASQMPQSELGRVEALNVMTLSSLRAKDRDMERSIHFWQGSLEGVKTLRSEQRLNEVLANYELMESIWPGEPRIAELRELIEHWE